MASAYTPIATTTLGSASTITFSSIPSTYTDLVIVFSGTMASLAALFMQFNGDTGTTYSGTSLSGDGSSASSGRNTSDNQLRLVQTGGGKTSQFTIISHIQNYANTSVYKTALTRASAGNSETTAYAGVWRSTSAINSVYLFGNGGTNIASGTVVTIYGIKAV